MGQAVADLPDPLESASHAEAQSADDLLSQLAGDEIDRLLAESDGDAPPTKDIPPQDETTVGEAQVESEQVKITSAKIEIEKPLADPEHLASAGDAAQSIASEPLADAPSQSAHLESAHAQAGGLNLDDVLETAVAERDAAAAEKAALHAADKSAAPAQKQQVQASKAASHEPHAKKSNAQQIELGENTRRLPLILRPLEWLSSPLDPWPDQLREMIGKIGLMTLINALAVLAYVLLVRRHHH